MTYYNRQHPLYPLSYIAADSERPHTLVTACTGAGKTDYLLRRCRGRVFYTLPFQASINSMYERLKHDMGKDNPDLDIRVLHAASRLTVEKNKYEEKTIQGHMGSAVKVLTPHQLASVVFGTRGYEATLMDLRGCDVILDEIHTYTNVTRSIVLKIVEMLKLIGCRIHIGTATMSSVLTNRIRALLGPDTVHEVALTDEQLDQFDRHGVHKISSYDDAQERIAQAVADGQKVLVVANRVETAQQRFQALQIAHPNVPMLLLHSRFKRGERGRLEQQLTGKRLDATGRPIYEFNTGQGACIVVSTQVVEVSLDISFDLMITDTAPLDALIQRFGRVNRKRTPETIGKVKPVFVIAPPETEGEAKPYELAVLEASFNALPDGDVLRERNVQALIDQVFPDVDNILIDKDAIYVNGRWRIEKLVHKPKSVLFDALDIDSMVCVTEADQQAYEQAGYEERMAYEIPVRYHAIAHNGLARSEGGNKPFIVPDKAYDPVLGLQMSLALPAFYNSFF
ncbi:CRISPR-associated helicase Cas3' [Fibrella aquatilis]|uniref:CRISPR-associated helicase Cas3' n=1 Tax=Fibrella aquatilis TaxID=2817059 RepID=UPI001E5B03DF|nr:CRISPR-associated helicase Cas3' [Fibrella aquatilis]